MSYEWLDVYVSKKAGCTVEFKKEWGAHLYRVGGKMIGMRGEYKDGRPILTLKLAPEFGDMLRNQFEYVIPGYYMNKTHYNSIFLDSEVSEEALCGFVDESYRLVFSSLSKKMQREISVTVPDIRCE